MKIIIGLESIFERIVRESHKDDEQPDSFAKQRQKESVSK